MAIEEILDEIENLVVEARRVPFTNKCVIEDDDLIRLIDDLRNEIPREIQEANQMLQSRQQILSEAEREANRMIEQTKGVAAKMVSEHEIVRQAQEQAKEIMEKTMKDASALRNDSITYAEEVFKHLSSTVSNTLDVVQQARTGLNQMKK